MEYVWLAAFVVFVVIEAVTVGLVSIWFAVGSLAAFVAAVAGGSIWLQILVFLLVSGIVLALFRPIAKRRLKVKRRATNADRALGKLCNVTEDIDNIAGTGAVFVDGKTWTARSANGKVIKAGELVRPVRIEGVKLFVELAESSLSGKN